MLGFHALVEYTKFSKGWMNIFFFYSSDRQKDLTHMSVLASYVSVSHFIPAWAHSFKRNCSKNRESKAKEKWGVYWIAAQLLLFILFVKLLRPFPRTGRTKKLNFSSWQEVSPVQVSSQKLRDGPNSIARYSEYIITIYAKGYPLLSVVPLLIEIVIIKFNPQFGLNTLTSAPE